MVAEWKKVAYYDEVAIVTSTAPVDVTKAAAAVGSSAEAARQDHKHDITTAAPGTIGESDTPTEGTATSLSRSDHVHGSPASYAPSAHLLGAHTTDTLANLNLVVTGATLDDSTGTCARTPPAHAAAHKDAGGDEILLHELGEPIGAVDFAKQEATSICLDNQATAPVTPASGQLYYDTVDDHMYVYIPA